LPAWELSPLSRGPYRPGGELLYQEVAVVDCAVRRLSTGHCERLLGGGRGVVAQERLNVGVGGWSLHRGALRTRRLISGMLSLRLCGPDGPRAELGEGRARNR